MQQSLVHKIRQFIIGIKTPLGLPAQKTFVDILVAVCHADKVTLPAIAVHMATEVERSSNEQRLRRFFKSVNLPHDFLVRFRYSLFRKEKEGKDNLVLDRTNWEQNGIEYNFLVLTVSSKAGSIPLFWRTLCDKDGAGHRGNSDTQTRIDLLSKYISTYGTNRIKYLLGDREFIGNDWLNFLHKEGVPFIVRIRANQQVSGQRADMWIDGLEVGKRKVVEQAEVKGLDFPVRFEGTWLSGSNADEKEDALLVITNNVTEKNALLRYKKRWKIETFFQSIKKRGMDIESSRLALDRFTKLLEIVFTAAALLMHFGCWLHTEDKPIRMKLSKGKSNNEITTYKRNSFLRNGRDCLIQAIKSKRHRKRLQLWISYLENKYLSMLSYLALKL